MTFQITNFIVLSLIFWFTIQLKLIFVCGWENNQISFFLLLSHWLNIIFLKIFFLHGFYWQLYHYILSINMWFCFCIAYSDYWSNCISCLDITTSYTFRLIKPCSLIQYILSPFCFQNAHLSPGAALALFALCWPSSISCLCRTRRKMEIEI